jgi:hypothetical protein
MISIVFHKSTNNDAPAAPPIPLLLPLTHPPQYSPHNSVPTHPKFRQKTEKYYYGEKFALHMQETKKHLAATNTRFVFNVAVTVVIITNISIITIHNTSFVC